MGQTSPHLEAFAVARGAAASVYSIIERKPVIDSLSEAGKIPPDIKGEIELKNVHFQYPARPEVKVRFVGIEVNYSSEKESLKKSFFIRFLQG